MPTIKDVAREAGVSIATVSYVLNNKSDSISEDTRNSVLEAARRIGYTPNITARNLRYSRTGLIGYAWHEVPSGQVNPILDRFTYHLAHAAENAGYHILTFTQPADDSVPVYDELMRTGRLDGFVLAGTKFDDPRIELLMTRKFPFVSFGRSRLDLHFPWVDIDGERGVAEAIRYLLDLGHRRIALVHWLDDDSPTLEYRLQGYRKTLAGAGIRVPEHFVVKGEHGEQLGRDAMSGWLALPESERPTAIFAISDLEAIGVMNEAKERGLAIGEDVSVIGFDDVPMSQYLSPPLTTMQQPIEQIAELLIGMLQTLLNHETLDKKHLLIPPTLVKRGTCGPPKSL